MRKRDPGVEGKVVGGLADAAARAGKTRGKRRRWSVEEKTRIARESLASGETITAVASRHGITRGMLSSWRSQLREGKLAAGSSGPVEPGRGYVAVEVEARGSVEIEGRGVTVRLEGATDAVGVALIATALAGSR